LRLTEVINSTKLIFEQRAKISLMRLLFLFLLSILTIGFLLPTITSIDNSLSNFLLTRVYSSVCHQESAKCISIGGASMLVCARCSGIYAGAIVSGVFSLLTLVRPISTKLLILSAIPLVIDVFFTFTGVYKYSQSIAFASGLAFGGIIYLLIISELENLFSNKSFKGNE